MRGGVCTVGPAVLLLLGALAAAAGGQEVSLAPQAEREARAAMSQLRSPYTLSHTVDMCPSAGALRDSIRVAAAGGLTAEQIVEEVIARHGEQLRVLPKREGKGLWAWLVPPLALLGGAVLVATHLRRDRQRAGPRADAESTLTPAEREQVAAALRALDEEGEPDA